MAQNYPVTLNYAATVNADTSAGQNYFYILLTGNVTTFSFTQNTGDTPTSGPVYVVFQQDGTGSRTVGWASNIPSGGQPTITSTANKYTVTQFFFDQASQDWYGIVLGHN